LRANILNTFCARVSSVKRPKFKFQIGFYSPQKRVTSCEVFKNRLNGKNKHNNEKELGIFETMRLEKDKH
jgi:hypothetical protein